MKNINWPNRLSILRVLLIPVCVTLLQFNNTPCRVLALIVFCAAAFTDFLDGWLARKYQIVTNFGKFIDPVADKLLVLSTMIALCGLGQFPAWACIVILFRELAVDGLRLVAMEQGHVLAAGQLGKIKTTLQMLTLIIFLIEAIYMPGGLPYSQTSFVGRLMVWLSVIMTLWSGIDYFWHNHQVLSPKEGPKA